MVQGGSNHKSINYIDKVNLMDFKLQAFAETFFQIRDVNIIFRAYPVEKQPKLAIKLFTIIDLLN
jgi:hypothetical protein